MKLNQLNLLILAGSGFALAGCNGGGTSDSTNSQAVASTMAAIASAPAPSCNGIPTWNGSTAYSVANTAVVYNGIEYKNNWWTQGNQPDKNSGATGSGMPWTVVATCAAPGPTPSPTPTPTPTPTPAPSPTPGPTPTPSPEPTPTPSTGK